MRFGSRFNFGEHHGSLVFEIRFHALVVAFGIFSGAVLELEIAEVVIDDVTALQELIQLAAVRREVGSVRLDEKDEQKCSHSEREAGTEDGGFRRKSEEHSGVERHLLSHPSLGQLALEHDRALPRIAGYRLGTSA